ncbi:hypothetical protein ACERII_08660 [Evansella sp. AB-rgal1]|uniref:hypothetical protein n=1 Tax=Evansella sp. AB-rgal1 TaxID=3242696 RepID=UPI00359E8890
MAGSMNVALLKSVSVNTIGQVPATFTVTGICIDSEDGIDSSLFIALDEKNLQVNLEKAMERGITAAMWRKGIPSPPNLPENFMIFEVENVTDAILSLAKNYMNHIEPIIVTITGCDQTSTTMDLFCSVIKNKFYTHQCKLRENNLLELSLSILDMDRRTDIFICEYNLEQGVQHISEFLHPSFTIVANVSKNYDIQKVIDVETGMKASSVLILDGDDENLLNLDWIADVVSCGFGESNLFHVTTMSQTDQEIHFELAGVHMPFTIQSRSKADVKCALFSIALCVHLGILADEISNAIKDVIIEN